MFTRLSGHIIIIIIISERLHRTYCMGLAGLDLVQFPGSDVSSSVEIETLLYHCGALRLP